MKVACICNMNNNMFIMMRYLNDLEIEADLLLLNNETEHFRPECDAYSMERYEGRIKSLGWGDARSFFTSGRGEIRRSIEGYDIFIGCGPVPAFFQRIGESLDLFIPYGADLYELPFYRWKCNIKAPLECYLSRNQRKGVRASTVKIQTSLYYDFERMEEELGGNFARKPLLYLYVPEYRDMSRYEGKMRRRFDDIRGRYDIILFHHTRHIWKTEPNVYSRKGNDLLIKGFAKYVGSSGKKAGLVLFEYGMDVEHSKSLVEDLGIRDRVEWIPLCDRKDIMYGLHLADIASDEFYSGALSGVLCESMVMGKPVLTNLDLERLGKYYGIVEKPAVLKVGDDEQIFRCLRENESRPDIYRAMGLATRDWYDKHLGAGLAREYSSIVKGLHGEKRRKAGR